MPTSDGEILTPDETVKKLYFALQILVNIFGETVKHMKASAPDAGPEDPLSLEIVGEGADGRRYGLAFVLDPEPGFAGYDHRAESKRFH